MTITLNATTGISTPPVSVLGDTSGSITFAAPAVAGTNTQTLVAVTGTLAPVVSGTAQAATSGTSIDFTSIPSWVKKITVILNGVSLNSTSSIRIQIGGGSVETTGYGGTCSSFAASTLGSTVNGGAGFDFINGAPSAADLVSGMLVLTLLSTNLWVAQGTLAKTNAAYLMTLAGSKTTSTTLDRVRITTFSGTDTFDAGSVNILYE